MHHGSRLRLSTSLAIIITTLTALSIISSVPSIHAVPPNPITWAEKSPIPYRTAQAGVIGGLDGRIYVMGGYSSGLPNSTARAYDPRTDSWLTLTSMGTPTRGPGIAIDQNGLIYVISGFSGSGDINNVQVYNVNSNSWTSGTAIPTGVWMPGATTGKDGRIYVVGGELSGGTASNLLQIYNSSTNAWLSGSTMSTARKQFQAVAAPNGLIYAIGGMSGGGVPLATVEAYNITSNAWSAKASLPSAILVFGAALGPDGLIYVFGGSTNYTNNNAPFFGTVYSYDPTANQWYNNTQAVPTPRREVSAATSSYNGRMYVIGGANGTYLATNEEATVPASGPPPPPPPPPQPLVASITSITPNPAQIGQTVTFVGSGSDSDGDSIVAYHWRSSISGTIGTQATFTVNNLPAGTHNIYLSVQDNQGTWSPEAGTVLTIATPTTSGEFLGLTTFYWILLAIVLTGVGVFIGCLMILKKKDHPAGNLMTAPIVQGLDSRQ